MTAVTDRPKSEREHTDGVTRDQFVVEADGYRCELSG
jgi:hypothetical protein